MFVIRAYWIKEEMYGDQEVIFNVSIFRLRTPLFIEAWDEHKIALCFLVKGAKFSCLFIYSPAYTRSSHNSFNIYQEGKHLKCCSFATWGKLGARTYKAGRNKQYRISAPMSCPAHCFLLQGLSVFLLLHALHVSMINLIKKPCSVTILLWRWPVLFVDGVLDLLLLYLLASFLFLNDTFMSAVVNKI